MEKSYGSVYGMQGLTVRNGRLINERVGNCNLPINEAAQARQQMLQMKKANMMAEAMVMAKVKEQFGGY